MTYDTPFVISEWEWFKLQLRLRSLEQRGEAWSTRYISDDDHHQIRCVIWSSTTQQLIDQRTSVDEQRGYYDTWAASERYRIAQILAGLPTLPQSFHVERDVLIDIVYDYGMGSTVVCRYQGATCTWRYGETEDDEE